MVRVLMRQEKTMKVICNHVADPRIVLKPNAGSDRSWVWNAFDFTEGHLEETTFALRLTNSDSANEFKQVTIDTEICCQTWKVFVRDNSFCDQISVSPRLINRCPVLRSHGEGRGSELPCKDLNWRSRLISGGCSNSRQRRRL